MSDPWQLMPGQTAPIAIITSTDQRGVLWIVTAFCLATATVSLLIRAYVRVEISQAYGKDDACILGAFLLFVIQSSLVFFGVKQGIGVTISDVKSSNFSSLQKAYYASDLFYILALWTTKCSVVLLLLRLTAKASHALVAKIVLCATALLGLISFLVVALDCHLSAPWVFIDQECSGKTGHWIAVAVFDILTELAAFATLLFILWNVQLPWKKKVAVVAGFTFRLLMIAPIATRLHYLLPAIKSADPTLKLDNVVISTQVELVAAVLAATVPCLRPFMAATYTTWGGRVDTISGSEYHRRAYARNLKGGSRGTEGKSSKTLRSLRMGSSKNNTSAGMSQSQDEIALEPIASRRREDWQPWAEFGKDGQNARYPSTTTTTKESGEGIYHGANATNHVPEDQQSSASHDSQQMIIRRDLEWSVSYESPPKLDAAQTETRQ